MATCWVSDTRLRMISSEPLLLSNVSVGRPSFEGGFGLIPLEAHLHARGSPDAAS